MHQLSPFVQKLRPYISEGVKIIIWFFIIAALVIFSVQSLLAVLHPFSMDYGEAPLINQAARLAVGKSIYRADISTPPFTIANYPPLYVISLIPFLNWFDSPFHMARVVSVIATLFSAAFIGLTVRTFTKSYPTMLESQEKRLDGFRLTLHIFNKHWFAALIAVGCFIASPYVMLWSSLARIDSLALAFATAAIFIFVRWPRARWAWVGGGLMLIAAAYTRQSYILAAPLAAFIWLWSQNKRRALSLALLVGGFGIALFLLLNTLTDGGFFYNIVTANVNKFGWDRLKDNLQGLWGTYTILLLMGLLYLGIGWRARSKQQGQNPWWLIAPLLVGAFLSGLTIGKIGSNVNYFLELSAALALIAGIITIWSRPYPWRNAAVIFLLSLQLGLLLDAAMEQAVDWGLTSRRLDFAHLQLLEQEVKEMDDPVLADEYMGMLTMNDRPLYLQPFEVSQLANAEMWDQQPLLDDIANQEFDGILIHHFSPWPVHRERWTPEMLTHIEEFYRPVKTLAGTVIHIPRGETGIARAPEPIQNAAEASSVQQGDPTIISAASFVLEPSIAIHPSDPNTLAAIATRTSKQDCELPNCKVELVYYLSTDGGENWQEKVNFNWPQQVVYNGQVSFDSLGTLYLLGIRNNVVMVNQTTLAEDYFPSKGNFAEATRAQVNARPWLQINPQTGQLFLTLDAQESDMLFVTPSLKRSDDGVRWSTTVRADQHISAADTQSPRATGPDDIQLLFGQGEHISLVWVWDSEPWGWPRTVWMANSNDGGQTFEEPAPILETWGPINSTSANGQYAIVFRVGTEGNQQLAVATTSDHGKSWTSAIASGSLPMYFEADKGPGIGMAPNGTIDLIFYSPVNPSPECIQNVESWQQTLPFGRIDPCEYGVYYTFSKDGGLSFAEPMKLNDRPVRGEDFIRFQGASQVGSHLSIASGDDFAYPTWIGTPTTNKTQVYGVKIER